MKTIWIALSVVAGTIVLVGIVVLIWILLRKPSEETTRGFGDIEQHVTFTNIPNAGEMFSWFYPCLNESEIRPIILWLDGVTDLPPSLSANIAAFGPYDMHLNKRNESWVEDYNLLFIDAPLGTGFSYVSNIANIPGTVEENAEHLFVTLDSFYVAHEELGDAPLYIIGQGHGAQLALALAIRLQDNDAEHISKNLKGIGLGNPVVDPGLVMMKLGFYLEELAYVGSFGRSLIETLATAVQGFISNNLYQTAFNSFLSLGTYVNNVAGAVSVNMRYIVEKMTRESTNVDYFGEQQHLQRVLQSEPNLMRFMDEEVAPSLGIARRYDANRQDVITAFGRTYMRSAIPMVEHILQNTDIPITIYNGNLDAISNTPGQLDWVENLDWIGQQEFLNSERRVLVLNSQVEGYIRETDRLTFYWINAAGQSVAVDSPIAMRRVLRGIAGY